MAQISKNTFNNMPHLSKSHVLKTLILINFLGIILSCERTSQSRTYKEVVISASIKDSLKNSNDQDLFAKTKAHFASNDSFEKQIPFPVDQSKDLNQITWTVPEGWVELPGSGMRLATLTNSNSENKIECTIVVLEGGGGDLKSNIIRWIDQIDLPMPTDSQLQEFINRQERFLIQNQYSAVFIDLTVLQKPEEISNPGIMAVILEVPSRKVFIKMMGSRKAILENRLQLKYLAESIQIKD